MQIRCASPPVERCLACEAERSAPVERCLACEAVVNEGEIAKHSLPVSALNITFTGKTL
jgi:hypothetical protein